MQPAPLPALAASAIITLPALGIVGAFALELDPGAGGGVVALDTSTDAGATFTAYASIDSPARLLFAAGQGAQNVDALRFTTTAAGAEPGAWSLEAVSVSRLEPIRVAWSGASMQHGAVANVGDLLTLTVLPRGAKATIQLLRDGTAIPDAASQGPADSLQYTVNPADDGAALGAVLSQLTYAVLGPPVSSDTEPPRRFGLRIRQDRPDEIELLFSGAELRPQAPPLTAFAVSGRILLPKTLQSITIAPDSVRLRYSTPFVVGDAPRLSYTVPAANPLQDSAGNPAPAFTDVSVWSELPTEPVALVLKSTSGYKALGDGFVCASANSQYADTPTLPDIGNAQALMNGSGWCEMQCRDAAPARRLLGLTWAQNGYLPWIDYAVAFANGQAQALARGIPQGAPYTFAAPSPACLSRILRDIDSGQVTFETSDNGIAGPWVVRHHFAKLEQRDNLTVMIYTADPFTPIYGVKGQSLTNRGY